MNPDKRILALQSIEGFTSAWEQRIRFHKTMEGAFWEVNEMFRKHHPNNEYRYSSYDSFRVVRARQYKKRKTTINQ